jgi:hypothetical protein
MVHKAVCDILSNETVTASVGYLKTNSLELPGGVVVLFVDKATLAVSPPELTDGKTGKATTGKQRLLLADDGAAIYEAVRKAYEWEEANGGIPE